MNFYILLWKNNLVKRFRHWLGRNLLRVLVFYLIVIPLPFIYVGGDFFGFLFFLLAKNYREVALENLKKAFGRSMSEKEIGEITCEASKNIVKGFLEGFKSVNCSYLLNQKIRVEGRDFLDQSLKKGRGVILLSAHFGNFSLIGNKLNEMGYKFNVIITEQSDVKLTELIRGYMNKIGQYPISPKPRKACIQKSLRCLKNNELLLIVADEDKPRNGIYVDFFGYPASTATGPTVLSMRTNSPIVPIFALRCKDNSHVIKILEPFELITSGDVQNDIKINTQRWSKVIEDYIRQYPTQWMWINKRWRTRS
ncbi:MAG: lysophospholipid acyltransferase family protein [bacterium]